VCLVSEAIVEQYLNGWNPLGMQLELQRSTMARPGVPVEIPTVEISTSRRPTR